MGTTQAPDAYINAIRTAVPLHDGHAKFVSFLPRLIRDERHLKLIQRLASRCQIEHRYSVLKPSPQPDRLDEDGFFEIGRFPSTARRMARYRDEALPLAERAVKSLLANAFDPSLISHLIVTSCTGFYAPGLDLELQERFHFRPDLERTVIGFMGCYAAFGGLKAARHIVRSIPDSKVLLVNLELCSLHLQESDSPEKVLGFLQFADGCAASLISAEPTGLRIRRLKSHVVSKAAKLIQWEIADQGFDMVLSPDVPRALRDEIPGLFPVLLDASDLSRMKLWAIHPGGRSILDVVQEGLRLSDEQMRYSRRVLRDFGNMSSATIMFVLKDILEQAEALGPGMAMAFGPGLTIESMVFEKGRGAD